MNHPTEIPSHLLGPRRVGAATRNLMESYKDDYPSHAKGISQEVIQNSVDARVSPQSFKDLIIEIEYDSEERNLRVRDYGTTGMTHCPDCYWGRDPKSPEDCHRKGCKWGNFHYLGGRSKTASKLGSRGQGKSLIVSAGEELVVRTKIIGSEHMSMASRWTKQDDADMWDLVPKEAMSASDKPGTEFIIKHVGDELHEQLMQAEEVMRDISATWFKIIQRGAKIRYGFKGRTLQLVKAPEWPTIQKNDKGQPQTRRRASMPISIGRKVVGEFKDVEVFLSMDPVPEDFRGIALVRNGTQVIERVSPWARGSLPPEIEDRIFGWAVYETTEERPFLHLCERPGHRGFRYHSYYRKSKEALAKFVEEWAAPLARQDLKPTASSEDRRRAESNREIMLAALKEIPEFNPFVEDAPEGVSVPKQAKPEPTAPYVASIALDKDYYVVGDTVTAKINILNPTSSTYKLNLTVEALNGNLSQLAIKPIPPEELPMLGPANSEEKGKVTAEVKVLVSEDFEEGKNWLKCVLVPQPEIDDGSDVIGDAFIHQASKALWVGKPPEKGTRSPGGSARGGPKLVPISQAALDPVLHEVIPYWDVGEIWFYTRGARIAPYYEKEPRVADMILHELISEAIAEKVIMARLEADPREALDKTQILEEYRRVDELRKRYLRACAQRAALAEVKA